MCAFANKQSKLFIMCGSSIFPLTLVRLTIRDWPNTVDAPSCFPLTLAKASAFDLVCTQTHIGGAPIPDGAELEETFASDFPVHTALSCNENLVPTYPKLTLRLRKMDKQLLASPMARGSALSFWTSPEDLIKGN